MGDTLSVFTNRGKDRLLKDGGSQSWALDPVRALSRKYIVCIQNRMADDNWGNPTAKHRHAFLVGKIKSIDPSPEGREGRYIIRFDEYAEIDKLIPHKWRNPVRYTDLSELGVDPSDLTFKRVRSILYEPQAAAPPEPKAPVTDALDIATAKKALAKFYGVSSDAIEIVIRG